jgi:hypothetical protein
MSGDDEKAAEQVARQFIERNGAIEALRMLNELADVAHETGDHISAKAWRNIAGAVERLSMVQ